MIVWSTLGALALSALTLGFFRDGVPLWIEHLAEFMAVAATFVLVCLFESGGGKERGDRSGASS